MKKRILIVTLVIVTWLVGCQSQEQISRRFYADFNPKFSLKAPRQKYQLDRGLEVHVLPTQPQEEISYDSKQSCPTYHFSGREFFSKPTVDYIRSMGFVEMFPSSDYHLNITVNQADLTNTGGIFESEIIISVLLKDANGTDVFSQRQLFSTEKTPYHGAFVVAYNKVLEQINWNRIASFLRTEQLPQNEPQNQVQGLGNTALEQTIIRWDVQSRPQGADIFWRVVSTTPDVKSTNNKYLQTTPYEATKALDIRGLTYQTSGNVRIILRCEKDGYMPQEKEFDVRMVLDQEEISAFFRLVKEE